MPKSLYPKKESKKPIIPPMIWFYIAFIILFALAIILAFACRGAFYYNAPLA